MDDFSQATTTIVAPSSVPAVQIRSRGVIFTFTCFLLLGFMPIITNSRPSTLNAISFAFYLSVWELIFSLPLLISELRRDDKGIFDKKVPVTMKKKTFGILLITSLMFSATTFLYVFSLEKAGTISASIALQAYPLFSILIEALALRKMKNLGELGFTTLLIGGIYYLGTEGTWAIRDFSAWFGLALVVPLLWAIAHVTIRQTLSSSPVTPNQITFIRVLITSLVLGTFAISSNGLTSIMVGFITPQYQLFAILMGVFYYLELVFWFYAIRHIDVSVASSITAANPILTMIFALIILQEAILAYQIYAMLVVILGMYGMLYFGRNKS